MAKHGHFNKQFRTLFKFKKDFEYICYIVAILFLFYLSIKLVRSIYKYFIRSQLNLVKKFGKWAIITGATDGIGKAIAFELYNQGMSIFLISRNKEKLDLLLKEFPSKDNQNVKIYQMDCSKLVENDIRKSIKKELESLDNIGILVNNVGVSYDFPSFFDELEDEKIENIIHLNIFSSLYLSKMVLPLFKKNGIIVNTSSGSARFPVPMLSVYSAAKRFLEQFTLSMSYEYDLIPSNNIKIQCFTPMFVTTKLAKIRKSTFFIPTPETYAKSAVKMFGYDTLISPYWPHALEMFIYSLIPAFIFAKIAFLKHMNLRERALKKKKSQ